MDKSYLTQKIQLVLNKEFSIPEKRKVIEYHDRINFACPYCKDSLKNIYHKRGNIWFNKLLFICFNCDKKTSFDKLCKDFNEQIDPDKKLEIIEHLSKNIQYSDYEDNFIDAKFEKLVDFDQLESLFNKDNRTPITNFTPIIPNGGVFKYLIGRGIPPEMHKNIYQAKYWKNEDEADHIICFLNRRGNKILGMQIRNLKEGKRRYFKIYNYEALYKWIHGDDIEIDLSEIVVYNKLSYYFNILNVDFNEKISIFEGYIDSMFYPNSIGLIGVNTDDRFLENNNLDIQYMYDNDDAGFKKSEEKIKLGFKVFLWKKLFEFIIKNKKTDDSYKLEYRINKVKDLNQLAKLVNNPYKTLNLENFFSSDVYDIKYIPKTAKKKFVKFK